MLTESQSHGITDMLKIVYPLKLCFAGGYKYDMFKIFRPVQRISDLEVWLIIKR